MPEQTAKTHLPLKPAKSIQDQIAHLRDGHGLVIEDKKRAEEILETVNYYRLSAYGIGLLDVQTNQYAPGTSIEQLYALYQFDAGLRNILSAMIEPIEIHFRTQIAYRLAIQYGPEGYRDRDNFNSRYHCVRKGDMHDLFCQDLQKEIQRQQKRPFVQHHLQKYGGHFPIWAAVELCSFGMLSSLYAIMKKEDQKAVAVEFRTKPVYMKSWFAALVELRNICAHYGRIYNLPFTSMPKLSPPRGEYANCRLFTICLAIQYILNDEIVWHDFVSRLRENIENCPYVCLERIGFPADWEEVFLQDSVVSGRNHFIAAAGTD